MQEADLKTVFEIEQGANAFPWSLKNIQDSLFNASTSLQQCWVCCLTQSEVCNEIIAYAIVSSVLDESDLLNLCVSSTYQGQGYGRKFLEYLLMLAQQEGKKTFFLEVRASNKKAIGLYEAFNFTQLSVRKAYYPSSAGREDALVYSLSFG